MINDSQLRVVESVVQLETSFPLNEVEREKGLLAKEAMLGAGMAIAQWIERMRDFRAELSKRANGSGQSGWERVCLDDFGCDAGHANRMINGWEALFLDQTGARPAKATFTKEINPTCYAELGGVRLKDRMNVAGLIREGEIKLTKKAIRDAAKMLRAPKALQPAKAPPAKVTAPAKLPTPRTGKTKVLSKAKYGYLDDQKTQLNYFKGKAAANAKLEEELPALIRACSQRGAGKATVLKALAGALHRELKNVSDRFYGRWNHDSGYPAYMTLWQSIWAEEADYKLGDDLEAVRFDMAQSSKFYELTVEHVFTTDVEVLE